ncbi:hypothetical protein AAZX31_07G099400 [Glycine max]
MFSFQLFSTIRLPQQPSLYLCQSPTSKSSHIHYPSRLYICLPTSTPPTTTSVLSRTSKQSWHHHDLSSLVTVLSQIFSSPVLSSTSTMKNQIWRQIGWWLCQHL